MARFLLSCVAVVSMAACGGTGATEEAGPGTTEATDTSGGETAVADSGSVSGEGGEGAADGEGDGENEFRLQDAGTSARDAHGETPSQIEPTETEAAVKLVVVDKDKGPIKGIVVKLTDPDGKVYYTEATDGAGYTEILLPAGKRYDMVYLSLGRKDRAASVNVGSEPKLTLRLTLRYKGWEAPPPPPRGAPTPAGSPRFVLAGVEFDSGKATLRTASHAKLEPVVEYMKARASTRIEISGHTDNVGSARGNKALSKKRAEAVRAYLISQGIEGSRIKAVGYGDTLPIAPNETPEGRQRNRRIEATEL